MNQPTDLPDVNSPQVSLILPAHNEELRLPDTLHRYLREFKARYGEAFEVVVVCNGCTDATVALAHAWAHRWTQLRVLNIPQAVGKGAAVLAGFRAARAPQLLFADADAATEASSLFELLDSLQGHDVIIGSRRLPDSVIVRPQPPLRRLSGGGFAWLVRRLFQLPYRDTQCGAKAFRREAALLLADRVTEARWTFDLDLLLQARSLGLTVQEQPVVWTDREGSQLRMWSTAQQVTHSLWQLKRRQSGVRPRRATWRPTRPAGQAETGG